MHGKNATTLAVCAAAMVFGASTAAADTLDSECAAVDASDASSCQLERRAASPWTLTTSMVVGGGAKPAVAAVEHQFCSAARHRGVEARVVRWNAIGAVQGGGAKMEWDCGPPGVASGPPHYR